MFSWIGKNPLAVVIGCLVALLISAFVIYRSVNPAASSATNWSKVWCYDLSKGAIIVGTEKTVPPFSITGAAAADGSPAGVRAEVFSCGDCADESQRFVGWLWKFTPEVAKTLQEIVDSKPKGFVDDNPYDSAVAQGDPNVMLIASPDRLGDWYPAHSEEAGQIKENLMSRCMGQPAKPCSPK